MLKVFIVDDSAFLRKKLSEVISKVRELEVVGTAMNGATALIKLKTLYPDILLIDVDVPNEKGLDSLRDLLQKFPLPSLLLGSFSTKSTQQIIEALQYGAVDFIVKPDDIFTKFELLKEELLAKLKVVKNAVPKAFTVAKKDKTTYRFTPSSKKIVVIASSTGGPQTLEAFLTLLPKNTPAPLLIVQHMPPLFTKSLAERLNALCEIEVREAKDGDKLQEGVALIAPGGMHMEVNPASSATSASVILTSNPPELGVRPNANRLFKSAVPIFKDNIVAIILTGMGYDGTEGAKSIKECGGTVMAEAEESCIIYGMPKSVVEKGYADLVVVLEKMPVALLQLLEV